MFIIINTTCSVFGSKKDLFTKAHFFCIKFVAILPFCINGLSFEQTLMIAVIQLLSASTWRFPKTHNPYSSKSFICVDNRFSNSNLCPISIIFQISITSATEDKKDWTSSYCLPLQLG